MKAINIGNIYEIANETVSVYDELPAQSYIVRFSKQRGFFLEKYMELEIKEDKIYGVHNEKVQKVLNAFSLFERNLGVMLSGDKGIGKSLFAKILAAEAVKNGYPLIIVDSFIPGIASYLETIQQEVVVLFDEFDKTFKQTEEMCPQDQLLSLFDGVSPGKKMFVITCNDFRELNDFLLNRPGRIHYHFRFGYPTCEEVKEYLKDKVSEEYHSEILEVVKFSRRVKLNYDCLRAIAFELNTGISFAEAIRDLNILNMGNPRYDITAIFENGKTLIRRGVAIDFFNPKGGDTHGFYNIYNDWVCDISYSLENSIFDEKSGEIYIRDNISIDFCEEDGKLPYEARQKEFNGSKCVGLVFRLSESKDYHYAL